MGATRFALDEWMATLFFPDSPPHPSWEWVRERVERCEQQIWSVCRRLLTLEQDVVLDLGLPKRHDRENFSLRASEAGAALQLHWVEADRETRKARVLGRHHAGGDSLGYRVTEEMFDSMEDAVERPIGPELEEAQVVRTGGAP
ncbi:MAG: AAA family ATPase [Acidobacteriota bacterium]